MLKFSIPWIKTITTKRATYDLPPIRTSSPSIRWYIQGQALPRSDDIHQDKLSLDLMIYTRTIYHWIRTGTLPSPAEPWWYNSHPGASPSSWLLQTPPRSRSTRSGTSACGSGTSCVGWDQTASHLGSCTPCSKTLGYLRDKLSNSWVHKKYQQTVTNYWIPRIYIIKLGV